MPLCLLSKASAGENICGDFVEILLGNLEKLGDFTGEFSPDVKAVVWRLFLGREYENLEFLGCILRMWHRPCSRTSLLLYLLEKVSAGEDICGDLVDGP